MLMIFYFYSFFLIYEVTAVLSAGDVDLCVRTHDGVLCCSSELAQ